MSLANNARLRQLLALHASGDLLRARRASSSMAEWAAHFDMTAQSLEHAIRRARAAGYDLPRWSDSRFANSESVSVTGHTGPFNPDTGNSTGHKEPEVEDAESCGDFDEEEPTKPEGKRAPGSFVVPPNFNVRGRSTLVRPDGSIVLEWVKTTANTNVDPVEVLRAAFGEMPKSEPVAVPAHSDNDLLACIAFGDPHFGQLSWHKDSGENFDLDIAERNMVAATAHLITIAPPAGQCLLIWIGDNTHSDGQSNTTTKGTRVDVDGRTIKMLAVTIRAFRKAIELALAKFGRVHGIIERGNHDELLSAVIALALSQYYENDPRVFIDTSPEMYHWYRFGQNLIGTHHGDKAKPMDLLGVMANDRKQDWGETSHRRFYCGHIHHEVVKEVPGLTVEYLRTLAPSDAWHRGQGYRAGRDLRLDVFHREHGMINRSIVGIERVRRTA